MQTEIDIAVFVVAAGGGIATFIIARQALHAHSSLNSPIVLAGCVAVMSFFGLLKTGPIIVVGFAALGFTCLAIPFVRFLINQGFFQPRSTRDALPPLTRLNRPTTPVVPERREQPPSTIPSRDKKPGSSSPVIPLDIHPPAGAPRNRKKPIERT